MKILFVNPKISESYLRQYTEFSKRWEKSETNTKLLKMNQLYLKNSFSGLGLLTIASMLKEEADIEFVDENVANVDYQKRYDLVALGGMSLQARRGMELAGKFIDQGTPVVIGGINATTFPEDYKREGISVVIGEGEPLFRRFLQDLERGGPKVVYKSTGSGNMDLGESPLPRFELTSHHRYSIIGIQTTRGCPHNCEYCNVSNILGTRYRHKPIERVLDEIRSLRKFWPRSVLFFCDDNLFADKRYTVELFRRAKEIDLGAWATHADVSICENKGLLELISKNGEAMLAIGFETLSEANLRYIGNPIKARLFPQYQDIVDELKDRGIQILGLFMFGFENDSEDHLEKLVEFIGRNGIDWQISPYTALPGTSLYSRLTQEYESKRGPLPGFGTSRFRRINDYLLEKNGYTLEELETMILEAYKKLSPSEVPVRALAPLALNRCLREGVENPGPLSGGI